MYKFASLSVMSVVLILSGAVVSNVNAVATDNFDWGSVKLNGSVLNSACTIDVKNNDQTLDMARVRNYTAPLNISLENCILNVPFGDSAEVDFKLLVNLKNETHNYLYNIITTKQRPNLITSSAAINTVGAKTAYISGYSLQIFTNDFNLLTSDSELMRISFLYF